jgi:hypothetical protein
MQRDTGSMQGHIELPQRRIEQAQRHVATTQGDIEPPRGILEPMHRFPCSSPRHIVAM